MKRIFYGEVKDNELKFDDKDAWGKVYKEFSGQAVEITVQPLGKRRNSKQNRFYWKVLVNELSTHFGYTPTEMHKALKLKFDVDSTSKLTVVDFSQYIESIIKWAEYEQGFLVPITTPHESSD
jgi:hypothetical protein